VAGRRGLVCTWQRQQPSQPAKSLRGECSSARRVATLLLDLLTAAEEQVDLNTAHLRFDIGLLGERLLEATDWLGRETATRGLSVGYFGASAGAAAALAASAERPSLIQCSGFTRRVGP
jgi:hypothetical protein